MDDYKKILSLMLVPSFTAAMTVCGVLLISYSVFLNLGYIMPGIFFIFAAIMSAPFAYKNSLHRQSGKRLENIAMASLFILLCLSAAFYSISAIRHISTAAIEPDPPPVFTAEVESVTMGRYSHEALLKYNSPDGGIIHIAAYIYEIGTLSSSDAIEVSAKPRRIDTGKKELNSFERRLLTRGITHTVRVDGDRIRILKKTGPQVKDRMLSGIFNRMDSIFGKDTSAFLKALYFGNKNHVDKETIYHYKRSGVLHILAASGFNVAVMAAAPLFIFALFRLNRKASLVFALASVIFYLYLTEMPVSLIRACIMFAIFVLQHVTGLDKNIFNTLFISATAILLVYPYEIFNPGFQLSFGATLGIILFYGIYRKKLSYLPSYLSESASLTLSAQIFVMPVILIQMGEINLSGIMTNLVSIPAVTVLIYTSLSAMLLSFTGLPITGLAASITDKIHAFNNWFVISMSGMNWHFTPGGFNPAYAVPFILILLPLLPALRRRSAASISIMAGFLLFFQILTAESATSIKPVTIFYHGTGSAALIQKNGSCYLTGSIPDLKSAQSIIDFLWKNNIPKINLIITEPDWQNINSYTRIIKNSIVRKCCISSSYRMTKNFENFIRALEADKVNIQFFDNFNTGNPEGEEVQKYIAIYYKSISKDAAKDSDTIETIYL